MDGNSCKGPADGSGASPPSEAWLFAQAVLGKTVPSPFRAEADARARREHLEWLAQISPEDARRVRGQLSEEADARAQRKELEWAAQISTECESKLRTLLRAEAEAREGWRRAERFTEMLLEGTWDPSQHPRVPKGQPDGGQWVATGGLGGANATKPSSFLDAVARRNATIAGLTGATTPGMNKPGSLAAKLQSAAQLAGEVASAAAAGLLTGVKAVVNGSATAIKSVATLGLDTSQLELIGVTKEDRANGYDTAVRISTASGQLLIAVGTGGVASALSKGGTVARTASGALIAFDAAGNAVGVVQGIYDATQNGVSISNGAQIAGGLLGLGANINAARGLKPTVSAKEVIPSTPNWTFGGSKSTQTWQNQMQARGWTPQQINEAISSGQKFPATNHINPGNSATRYVNPRTGRSVVIDNTTGEVIHVGGNGFKY